MTDSESVAIVLDLRRSGRLPAHLLRRLDSIKERDVARFNDMIGALSAGRERNIDWWVTRPATRNNHVSTLYAQCMQISLIRDLLDEGARLIVHVDSPQFRAVLRAAGDERLTIVPDRLLRARWRRALEALAGIGSSIFHTAAAATAASLTRTMRHPPPTNALTVINTFVVEDSVASGVFRDRYYPGFLTQLADEEKRNCVYLPVFYRLRHYLKIFRVLRRNPVPFVFYEDSLRFSDYFFAFGHWRRAARLTGKKTSYAGFEVGLLVDADILSGRFASIVVRALLAYRFYRHHRDFRIRHVLDWYEGLDLNHAIAAGIRWHALQVGLTGFRSAGSIFYMSATPAPHEEKAGVLPKTMAVVGPGLAQTIKAGCPTLNVIPAPGFRYRKIIESSSVPKTTGNMILLVLPLFLGEAIAAITFMAETRARSASTDVPWAIKSHPILPEREVLAALDGALPEGFKFVQGDFQDLLMEAGLIAGTGSSALIEAVAQGIPALCIATGNLPTENPVPDWVGADLSRVVYDAKEAANAIAEMLSREPGGDLTKLRSDLLGSVNPAVGRQMLELPKNPQMVSPDGIEPSTL